MSSDPEEFHLKQIRTFQGDMAEALKRKGESVITLAEREQIKQVVQKEEKAQPKPKEVVQPARPFQEYKRPEPVITEEKKAPALKPVSAPKPAAPAYTPYQGTPTSLTPKPTSFVSQETLNGPERHTGRTFMLVLGTLLLLALGAGVGWYAYMQYKIKTALPDIVVASNQFITPQSVFTINTNSIGRDDLLGAVRAERGHGLTIGAIHEIELRDGQGSAPLTTTEHFLVRGLVSQMPGSLTRAFDPLFMLGTIGTAVNEPSAHTFLLIKLDSFENAFPGMLVWEPNMQKDILPLFASDETIHAVAPGTPFSDITIQNKDARVLKDASGKTLLLYSFYDNNLLLITDNETSLRALISALNAKKTVR